MEVGYQSELNWNCAVVQQYVPSIAKLKTSLIIPCQLGSFPLPGVHGGLCNPTQRAEAILNKISNNINKTHTGLISVLKGFQKCIALDTRNRAWKGRAS